jgi:hypothetical protein
VVVVVVVVVAITVVGKRSARIFAQLYPTGSIVLRVFSPIFTCKALRYVSAPRQLERVGGNVRGSATCTSIMRAAYGGHK